MDPTPSTGPSTADAPVTIRWYSRAAIDEYLAGAESERVRLQAQIADAGERLARASAALGLHQTMMEMLLESQRDIREIRQNAEAASARIIADAEREAATILRDAPRLPGGPTAPVGPDPVVRAETSAAAHSEAVPVASAGDDEFFTYLRGALDEGGPLGSTAP